ncbi:MAG: SDR family oxidoreductase [Rhodospirillaceae bacterium]
MDLQLDGRVVIVTGSSQGLGRNIAMYLRSEGARVVITARSTEKLEELAATDPENYLAVPADLRDGDKINAVVKAAIDRFGRIDGLVNNAGNWQRGAFADLPDSAWEDAFTLKYMATVRFSRACWPELVKNNGAIVNVLGVAGRLAFPAAIIGGSFNAALFSVTKSLGQIGIKEGVRVNGASPGLIAAESTLGDLKKYASKDGITEDAALKRATERLGIARLGTPEEFSKVVAFLLSPSSGYCQGAIVEVDGGQNRAL